MFVHDTDKTNEGVNTGFGGSANTRTDKVNALQQTLLREFNSGVLPTPTILSSTGRRLSTEVSHRSAKVAQLWRNSLPLGQGLPTQDLVSLNRMPVAWVRAAMLIRLNSLIIGCSGIRNSVVEKIIKLLELDVTPMIPMHGSLSACGDLAPLSYIGSAIQGKSNVFCTVGALNGQCKVLSASEALSSAGLKPEKIEAKEALAIMNGTAVSCAVAALVMHEVHGLVVMSEILTAMSVEALAGTDESFDPFFARVRPHSGQIDSSRCIRNFLKGSKLLHSDTEGSNPTLKQDRYSIRTAAQWLSPVLEDLELAHSQIETECNSVTDNPLIDVRPGEATRHLHGGNFQARAVTSAMEKVRLSLQSIGRLLFTQCTEIINPATNHGLPPNLVADEPSESFVMKSVDIMVAALLSELGFLANPVGSHVQTAEMGNQALNSLALISARYALNAVDITSKLVSAHLLVACQALDLRVMDTIFLQKMRSRMSFLAKDWHERISGKSEITTAPLLQHSTMALVEELSSTLYLSFEDAFKTTTTMDSHQRFSSVAKSLQTDLLSYTLKHQSLQRSQPHCAIPDALETWTHAAGECMKMTFDETRHKYLNAPNPRAFLGPASLRMWEFVRLQLEIPFINTDVLTGHPPTKTKDIAETVKISEFNEDMNINSDSESTARSVDDDDHGTPPTVGSFVTRIYESVRGGALFSQAVQCLGEANRDFCQPTTANPPVNEMRTALNGHGLELRMTKMFV